MPGVEFGFGAVPREELEVTGASEETAILPEGLSSEETSLGGLSPEGAPVQGAISEMQGQADVEGRTLDTLENVESQGETDVLENAGEQVMLESSERQGEQAERAREEYREIGAVALAATEAELTELSEDPGTVGVEMVTADLGPVDTAEAIDGGESVGKAASFELDMLSPAEATNELMTVAAVELVEEKMKQNRALAERMHAASEEALGVLAKAEDAETDVPKVETAGAAGVAEKAAPEGGTKAEEGVQKVEEAPKVIELAPKEPTAEVAEEEPKDDFVAYIESVLNAA